MSRSRLRCIGAGLKARRSRAHGGRPAGASAQLASCVVAGLLATAAVAPAGAAPAVDLEVDGQRPLFLEDTLNPNILVMLDTSQSMDATMGGKVISGLDPATRSNIARTVLRDVISAYRTSFNWGLGSFDVKPSAVHSH